MNDTNAPVRKLPSGAEWILRRKVRKGTQSCWECKRRKIKCTFTADTDDCCNGCRRRGTPCVSQEFPQRAAEHVGDRLGRVEALVQQLVKDAGANSPSIPSPREGTRVLSKPSSPFPATTGLPIVPLFKTNEEVCRALLAVWPSKTTLNNILSVPVNIVACFHGSICTPPSSIQKLPSAREMLQLPPWGSHPVLIARKLLALSSYLQAVLPTGIHDLLHRGTNNRELMSSLVETVHGLVNSNDDLIDSIEGLDCIMMESMHHNNAGNLRRAWLTTRRAMLVAQMMGLHKNQNQSSMKILDSKTCVKTEHIWLDIVTSDRYLSLMLGLPQGSPDTNSFDTAKALEGCKPEEYMQRIHCIVGGHIIKRGETEINDPAAIQELDTLLQKASMSMTPQWWLIPDFAPGAGDKIEDFHNTHRLMGQFAHYHLVARLHLPYLLRPFPGDTYQYSKITAVNASREVLARFVAFRSCTVGSYCRGIDFLAFIATTTLCLAHIDACRWSHNYTPDEDEVFAFSSLAHQRPSDRGMMERALARIEHMASTGTDKIASQIATILRYLLVVEADAADGGIYTTISNISDAGVSGCNGHLSDTRSVLRIHIPCLGTIEIKRTGMSKCTTPNELSEISDSSILPGQYDCDEATFQSQEMADYDTSYTFAGLSPTDEDWRLQGVDTALFESIFRGIELCNT